MKIANIEQRNSLYLLNDLRNFNEIFRKDVTYDNIKSHKKPGFYPLFRRYIFQKTTGKEGQIDPPAVLELKLSLGEDPNHFTLHVGTNYFKYCNYFTDNAKLNEKVCEENVHLQEICKERSL